MTTEEILQEIRDGLSIGDTDVFVTYDSGTLDTVTVIGTTLSVDRALGIAERGGLT